MRIFFIAVAAIMLFGCNLSDNPEIEKTKPFFDLTAYIKAEEMRLTKLAKKVKKITEVNNQHEERAEVQPNFREELAVFSQADINRPAWYDQYKADTIHSEAGQLLKLSYTALSSSLKTRSIEVTFDSIGNIFGILIKAKSDNLVASTEQVLTYSPIVGYTIDRSQDMALIPATRVKVSVEF